MPSPEYYEKIINKKPFGWTYADDLSQFHTFGFEEIDLFYWHDLVTGRWYWALYAGAAYIFIIFSLQRFMRDRPPLELKWPLFFWNLSLGIFSIIGLVRCLPGFMRVLGLPNGFKRSICDKKEGDIAGSFWTLMFILSKFWELGDTVFIVLRKRPLIFLQWYHHLVTMTVVWVLAPYVEPIARWYAAMNYGVHSLMYPYFAFKIMGAKIPTLIANFITTLQLTQMIIGFGVNMLSMYWQQTGQDCVRYTISIQVFSVVYGSFILLFGKVFYDSVYKSGRKKLAKQPPRLIREKQLYEQQKSTKKLVTLEEEDINCNRIKAD